MPIDHSVATIMHCKHGVRVFQALVLLASCTSIFSFVIAPYLSALPSTITKATTTTRIAALQKSVSSSNDLKVWYQLVDDQGVPFKNSQVWALSVPSDFQNFELCLAIFDGNSKKLANIDASDLKIFASLDDVNLKKKPLKPSSLVLSNPDSTADAPLYVVVPSTSVAEIIADMPQQQQRPSLERLKRWELLNPILAKNRKARTTTKGSTTPFSGVTWAEIKEIYGPILQDRELIPKPVPQDVLNSLHDYLTKAGKTFGFIIDGNEATRLHFMAPIIVHVCNIFDGEIKILVEEVLEGRNINVNGRFEFVLKRRNKRICIVEAKRDDIQQGLVQDLLGCEAVADLDRLNCVNGIVTNYIEWIFLKSLDNRIERSVAFLKLVPPHMQPSKGSLSFVAGCIYAMLSE